MHPERDHRRSRRRVGAGLLAASFLAVAALSGCASDDGGAPTLTWYINPDDGGQAEIAKRCTEASGGRYAISTSLLPRDASSQREQLARRLAAGDSSMDIMSLDPPFVPELAEPGFLAPVPQNVIDETTKDVVEGALAGATWKDQVVAVPFWANTQLLWYRKSVAEKAGLDMTQPVTWDQIMDAARETETQLGVQGVRSESMTVWVNALYESQGQGIIENPGAGKDEVELGIDTPAGQEAARIIGTIGRDGLGGPGLSTADESASMATFQSDKGSFMVNWPFVWPATESSKPELMDDIGWALYPRVTADQETAPPLGGIMLGVGSESQHPELAYEAITCIASVDNQAFYFESNGNPAAKTAAYDDAAVKEKFPMAPEIRESLEMAKPRPQTQYYNEVSTAVQQRWTPAEAVGENTPAATESFISEVLRGERLL
ncbi:extracellular solute-binding protein [Granulicoccus sp. GXG6511]|uniref:extracellular solute-binding protein n=1 Tax=Granulicoccus sp. GXG6511 TaxID=3381351 RepID=UPI003D7CBFEC